MNGRTRVGVYAVIIDDDQILLSRVASANLDAGIWTLPGGGVHFGEDPVAALHREVFEETGLRGELQEALAADHRMLEANPKTGRPPTHWIRLYFRMAAAGTPHVVEVGGSVDAAAWHPLGSLPRVTELTRVGLEVARGR